ncbi:MAG: right-handed parallel beta-helix repeat-containing protein, partial [Lysinibacillus sp.]
MAIIKVANTLFSSTKTIEKALKKCQANDDIHVAPAHYFETLHLSKNANIVGQQQKNVIIEGAIIIPEASEVTFTNVTFHPTAHIHIEGTAHFENCTFNGHLTNAIMSLASAHVTLKNCHLHGAKDIAIAAFKQSHIAIDQCTFSNNGKTHLLIDQSNGSITLSKFSKSTHALWLKNDASLTCRQNELYDQHGTQIIVQQSTLKDTESVIKNSAGNGLFASNQAFVELIDCVFAEHVLPQIWVQDSEMHCTRTNIENGQESGLMIRNNSNAYLTQCHIHSHKIANVQLCQQSRLNISQGSIEKSDGIGIQIRDQSIMNVSNATFSKNKLAQLFISDKSHVSISQTTIADGLQVGIIVEKQSNCSILQSTIRDQLNSGITVIESECMLIDSDVHHNNGNGLLVLNDSIATIDNCRFKGNKMPHLGAKNKAAITAQKCRFEKGKSAFIVEKSSIQMEKCHLLEGEGVQVELNDDSKGTFKKCIIENGRTNAMKFL